MRFGDGTKVFVGPRFVYDECLVHGAVVRLEHPSGFWFSDITAPHPSRSAIREAVDEGYKNLLEALEMRKSRKDDV